MALGAYFLINLERVSTQASSLAATRVGSAKHLGGVTTHIARFRVQQLLHILANDDGEKTSLLPTLAAEKDRVEKDVASYRELVASGTERTTLDHVETNLGEFFRVHDQITQLSRTHKEVEALSTPASAPPPASPRPAPCASRPATARAGSRSSSRTMDAASTSRRCAAGSPRTIPPSRSPRVGRRADRLPVSANPPGR